MTRPITATSTTDDHGQLLAVPSAGPTLLPSPIASLISLFSKSTTISIRLGSLVGEVLLDSARASTLTSLEVGKAVIEGILIRAGHDVENRRGEKGCEYVEGWTDKGIDILNSTVSLTQLLVSTGFRLSSATLSTVSEIAQNYVYTLDSILGSTESSRAISAIVSLIRREIISADEERQRANLGGEGGPAGTNTAKIGVVDLIIGLTCFAIIQVRTRQRSLREIKTKIVWDAIVMDGGKKVSMSEDSRFSKVKATGPLDETILALSNGQQLLEGSNGENAIHFLSKIPSNAEVNITTTTSTSQTTTIEIAGASPPDFNPPKGAVIISESAEHHHSKPSYKIVYQTVQETIKKRLRRKDGQLEVEVEECGDPHKMKALPEVPKERESRKTHEVVGTNGKRLKTRKSNHSILSQFAAHEPTARPNRPSLEIPDSTSTPTISLPSSPDRHPERSHRRRSLSRSQSQPYPASMYTLRTSRSQSSLLIQHDEGAKGGPGEDPQLGKAIFPEGHLCRNMSKYMRFASASYGQNFMRVLGIGSAKASKATHQNEHHYEHHAFSQHTNLPVDTILLSSFTDPGGGYDASGEVGTGVPLVHFVCVDHKAHAVVLTCRGTLGLEDVLTDLTCEYSDLQIRGETYRVHKGMLNSALLMLRQRSKVLTTIKLALEEFPTYGLVLTGHSLGGGVAAILSILLSQPKYPSFPSAGFLTASSKLPQGRPIHCYAYGPPACVCPRLRLATTSLITTTVFGADIVPSLSFGMIRDFYNVAVAFKQDTNNAASEIRRRILRNLVSRSNGRVEGADDDLYTVLQGLREVMQSEKLVPPGRVFWVESQVVFLKDLKKSSKSSKPSSDSASACSSSSEDEAEGVPLPPGGAGYAHATRITTKVVQDVEGAFREIGFGRGMISDHSPKNYEAALELLLRGVCDEEVEV